MARYSEERKEAVLSKLLPPYNMTVAELARQEGISEPTLYTWRNKAKSEGRPVPGRKATSEQWSAEAKLATVIETAALSEAELSQYCRKRAFILTRSSSGRWSPYRASSAVQSRTRPYANRLAATNRK